MANEKETKSKGFFKVLKQFVTGDGGEEENTSKPPVVPENEEELDQLMKKINPKALEQQRKIAEEKPTEYPPIPPVDVTTSLASSQELQMAEVAQLLQSVERMDKPGPMYAYFEFLTAKDGAGAIDPGTEKIVLKTIISALSSLPDLKGITPESLVKDAERQLQLLMEFSGKRIKDLETSQKNLLNQNDQEIKKLNSEIGARKRAIESIQAEIANYEKMVQDIENKSAQAASSSVYQLNSAKKAGEQVRAKIEKDIFEIKKYLIPPGGQNS